MSGSPTADVYFRPAYVGAYEVVGQGAALAVEVTVDGAGALVPLLLRPLSALPYPHAVGGYDAITAYGYGGILPLSSEVLTTPQTVAVVQEVRKWALAEGVVSVAFRLHPLLDQLEWLSPVAEHVPGFRTRPLNTTISLPLASWSEQQMKKGRRSDLSVARRALTVTCIDGAERGGDMSTADALRVFKDVYDATMQRLGASGFYLFPEAYYERLAATSTYGLAVVVAWKESDPVGAATFLRDGKFAHYHLSGTTDEGRSLKASTLMIREGIEWSRRGGCDILHLGGGLSDGDGLFEFKAGFGGARHRYGMATMVVDQERYDALVARRRGSDLGEPRPDFFPEYRA